MPKCNFKLEKSMIEEENPEDIRPMVMSEAMQVIECTWVKENGVELITEEHMKIIQDKRAKEKNKTK